MCNYYGMCDARGNVLGHSAKVTDEYSKLFSEKYELVLLASPCIAKNANQDYFKTKVPLRYDIRLDEPFTMIKRITDKIKILRNISSCFNKTSERNLFFYQVDFFFFFYLVFFLHSNKYKIYCLICHQDFTGGRLENLLMKIYLKGLKKLSGVIYTQQGKYINHPNSCWMPDFLYSEDKYKKYQELGKQEKAICVGTMNRYKQLEQLIEVFRHTTYPLEIIGRFDDKERLLELLRNKPENVMIVDEVLSEEEYYQKLGRAKFSIIPYDMFQYTNRTSGVLIESLFVGCIPIAPARLLEQNNLPGYGYNSIEELAGFDWMQLSISHFCTEVDRMKKEYDSRKVLQYIDKVFE